MAVPTRSATFSCSRAATDLQKVGIGDHIAREVRHHAAPFFNAAARSIPLTPQSRAAVADQPLPIFSGPRQELGAVLKHRPRLARSRPRLGTCRNTAFRKISIRALFGGRSRFASTVGQTASATRIRVQERTRLPGGPPTVPPAAQPPRHLTSRHTMCSPITFQNGPPTCSAHACVGLLTVAVTPAVLGSPLCRRDSRMTTFPVRTVRRVKACPRRSRQRQGIVSSSTFSVPCASTSGSNCADRAVWVCSLGSKGR